MTRTYTRHKPCWFLRNLVQLDGSVFPASFLLSLPPAAVAAVLVQLHNTAEFHSLFNTAEIDERIFSNSAVWSGFTFLVGFLVVFRTSHSYNRFWEACTSVHKMGAEWFDSCSALISYTKVSVADQAEVVCFQNKVVRLFSLLHAVALAELEDLDNGSEELEVRSFEIELVDAGAFDDKTLANLRDSTCRVELVYQWIQSLIVDAQHREILGVPAPILTRSFQELSSGMVSFHDAMKIADTPFPFPYSQTCDMLLFFFYVISPFVVSSYCSKWWLAAFFTFVVVFTYACLTLTGLEIEFPFGRDANDIQGIDMQLEMNHKLRLLVSKVGWRQPQLKLNTDPSLTRLEAEVALLHCVNDRNPWTCRSLCNLWTALQHCPKPRKSPRTQQEPRKQDSGKLGERSEPAFKSDASGWKSDASGWKSDASAFDPSSSARISHINGGTMVSTEDAQEGKKVPKAAKRLGKGSRVRAPKIRNTEFTYCYFPIGANDGSDQEDVTKSESLSRSRGLLAVPKAHPQALEGVARSRGRSGPNQLPDAQCSDMELLAV